MKNYYYYLIGLLLMTSCFPENTDDISIGNPPSASFTTSPSSENPNRIILTNTSENADLASWTYPGSTNGFITSKTDTAYFALAGDYEITLTVAGKGGTSSVTQMLNVPQTDPDGVDPVILRLTGGVNNGSKAWGWNLAAASFGVGPSASGSFDPVDPEDQSWFSAGENALGSCVENDSYIFTLNSEQTYLNDDGGDVQWGWAWANEELGTSQAEFADACFESTQPATASWQIEYREGSDGEDYPYLILTERANLGYYEGRNEYQIFSISETDLVLRAPFGDPGGGDNGWRYFKYVAK